MAWSYSSPEFVISGWNYGEGYNYSRYETFLLEQTGTDQSGITLKLSRSVQLSRTNAENGKFELQCGDETRTFDIAGANYSGSTTTYATTTADISVPSAWAGKKVTWRYKYLKAGQYVVQEGNGGVKFEAEIDFETYGQFKLTIASADAERISSPKAEADTGALSDGAAIYTGDVLRITSQPGYKLTVNDEPFNSGDETTVKSDVVIAASAMATLSLYSGGEWSKHLIYIYSGGAWGLYQAEIYSGGAWSKYF